MRGDGAGYAQRASSGTTVSDSTSDISTATDRRHATARGRTGRHARQQAERREHDDRRQRRADDRRDQLARPRRSTLAAAFSRAPVDVLHHDHRIVDDEADGDGQAAHRHQVDRPAEQPHEDERRDHGERQRDGGDQRQPPVAQEDQQDDDGEQAADQDGVADVGDRGRDELGEVVDLRDRAGRPAASSPAPASACVDAALERRGCWRRSAARC